MKEEPGVEYHDVDIAINVTKLREPFLQDLRGVILTSATSLIDDTGHPREGVTDEVAFEYLFARITNLVDLLVYEVCQEAMHQMAEQMGGSVVDSDDFPSADEAAIDGA